VRRLEVGADLQSPSCPQRTARARNGRPRSATRTAPRRGEARAGAARRRWATRRLRSFRETRRPPRSARPWERDARATGAGRRRPAGASRAGRRSLRLPGMSMMIASGVMSMIFPKTMSPAFTGGRSRGGPCFFSFFLSRGFGAACSSVASVVPSGDTSSPVPRAAPRLRPRSASSCDAGGASSSRRWRRQGRLRFARVPRDALVLTLFPFALALGRGSAPPRTARPRPELAVGGGLALRGRVARLGRRRGIRASGVECRWAFPCGHGCQGEGAREPSAICAGFPVKSKVPRAWCGGTWSAASPWAARRFW